MGRGNAKTAFLIVLPLGIVAIIAGLVVGNTNISLASAQGIYCGSAFGGGSGTLDVYTEAACAPLLSEHQLWATILLVLGAGLLISSAVPSDRSSRLVGVALLALGGEETWTRRPPQGAA